MQKLLSKITVLSRAPAVLVPTPSRTVTAWPQAIGTGNSHGVEMDPKQTQPGFLPSTGVRLSYSGTVQITGESLPHTQDLG